MTVDKTRPASVSNTVLEARCVVLLRILIQLTPLHNGSGVIKQAYNCLRLNHVVAPVN